MSHIEMIIHCRFTGSKPAMEFYSQTYFSIKKKSLFSISKSTIPQHGETGQSKGQIFALQPQPTIGLEGR